MYIIKGFISKIISNIIWLIWNIFSFSIFSCLFLRISNVIENNKNRIINIFFMFIVNKIIISNIVNKKLTANAIRSFWSSFVGSYSFLNKVSFLDIFIIESSETINELMNIIIKNVFI